MCGKHPWDSFEKRNTYFWSVWASWVGGQLLAGPAGQAAISHSTRRREAHKEGKGEEAIWSGPNISHAVIRRRKLVIPTCPTTCSSNFNVNGEVASLSNQICRLTFLFLIKLYRKAFTGKTKLWAIFCTLINKSDLNFKKDVFRKNH